MDIDYILNKLAQDGNTTNDYTQSTSKPPPPKRHTPCPSLFFTITAQLHPRPPLQFQRHVRRNLHHGDLRLGLDRCNKEKRIGLKLAEWNSMQLNVLENSHQPGKLTRK
jgi:hypothetical protein